MFVVLGVIYLVISYVFLGLCSYRKEMDNSSQLYNKMKKVVVVVWSRLPKVPEEEGKVEEDEEEGLMTYFGAGVVIDDRGYILTCAHLVPRGFEVTVRRSDEDAFQEAYVLHRSVKEDLAILRTGRVGQYEFCQFGDTSSLQMGMPVFALIHANKINNLHCSSCSHGAPVFDSTGKVLGLIAVTAGFDFAIRLPPLKKLVRWCKGHL
ncbi:uncharacterized protein LOC131301998 isoform X2 [Rhododendron vialii]|uniref:uncharacterized protein LOC131301998 isoform X2 n=1 Tax=Rhododendron vialii TaxID=182163 RepID=UPI00265E3DBE|nr:uncharacterized protein LOC131301998 isoform X2 [Rhododendron vialii]